MSQEHSEWLASLQPAEREALNKGLSALETMADLWAVEINLGKMSENIAGAPDLTKRAFAIKSMVEQGFIEGAYRTYLDYKDGKLPGQSARPEALRSEMHRCLGFAFEMKGGVRTWPVWLCSMETVKEAVAKGWLSDSQLEPLIPRMGMSQVVYRLTDEGGAEFMRHHYSVPSPQLRSQEKP